MKPTLYLTVLSPVLLGIMAIFMFAIGLRGIVTQRPFLIPARWFFYQMLLVFLPVISLPLWLGFSSSGPSTTGLALRVWLYPLMFGCILLMMWFQMQGYMAFAVTDQAFREALISALHKLNLPFEERLSGMRLTSVEADLQVAVQSWMGTGQIKLKGSKDRSLLSQIVSAMNEHFRTSSTQTNMTSCVFYTIMGIFLVIFAVGMLFFGTGL